MEPKYSIAIPQESAETFWAQTPQNAGLVFDRFVPILNKNAEEKDAKKEGFAMTLEAFKKKDSELLKGWNTRWEKTVQSVGAKPFQIKTDWRLIAGLGRKGMLEVGFAFHRYGFPYLPGSSLKGLARAYAVLEIAMQIGEDKVKAVKLDAPLFKLDEILSIDQEDKFEKEFEVYLPPKETGAHEMAQAFRAMFGTTANAGKAIFFDAIPFYEVKKEKEEKIVKPLVSIELDIMNPHYPDYYKDMENKKPTVYPTNWQSPIPVYFLTGASGSVFRFAVGWRNSPQDAAENSEKKQEKWKGWFKGEQIKQQADSDAPRLIKLARRWLQGGLLELGAGGKTSAGYGYFQE